MSTLTGSIVDALVILSSRSKEQPYQFVFQGKAISYSVDVSNHYPGIFFEEYNHSEMLKSSFHQETRVDIKMYQEKDLSNLFCHAEVTPTMRALALAIWTGDAVAALALADLVQESFSP